MSKKNQTDAQEGMDENTSTDSSTENETTDNTQSDEGDNSQTENKPVPFNEDPRVQDYIDRQWQSRESRLREELQTKFKEDMTAAIAANKPQPPKDEAVVIPAWFGGDEKQWKAYQADQSRVLSEAEKRAEDRAFERLNNNQTTQQKAVEDANKWFESSVTKIETETKSKVDRNELLQYVLDNQIIDHKTQKWDYARGYRWMMAEKTLAATKGTNRQTRKELADATTAHGGSNEKGKEDFSTAEDFRDPSKRPW